MIKIFPVKVLRCTQLTYDLYYKLYVTYAFTSSALTSKFQSTAAFSPPWHLTAQRRTAIVASSRNVSTLGLLTVYIFCLGLVQMKVF